ncbi:MAG: hypothetical protein KF905_09840 [Flavobacteriales bacterium]|nr:hypothetical protein [Flavobacteriales bacterium]
MSAKPLPTFDRRIFWDVDFDRLDHETDAAFIIERVFSWGDIPDVRQARRYYGDERVLAILLEAENLPFDSLHLISAIFQVPVGSLRSMAQYEGKDFRELRFAAMAERNRIHGLPDPRPWLESQSKFFDVVRGS